MKKLFYLPILTGLFLFAACQSEAEQAEAEPEVEIEATEAMEGAETEDEALYGEDYTPEGEEEFATEDGQEMDESNDETEARLDAKVEE